MNIEILTPSLINTSICVYPVREATYEYIWDWHIHNECEIYMETAYQEIFYINDKIYHLNKGDIIFVNERVPHKTKTFQGSKGFLIQSGTDIHTKIADEYLHRYITHLGCDAAVFRVGTELHRQLQACLEDILQEYTDRNVSCELFIQSSVYKIFALLYRNDILKDPRSCAGNIERLRPVLSYIDDHYAEPISLDAVSDLLNVNKSHFCRLFKKAANTTFLQYLNFIRVCKAEKLLLTTDKTISEIAEETGFSSPSYFAEVFKQNMSCPPSLYKRIKRINADGYTAP